MLKIREAMWWRADMNKNTLSQLVDTDDFRDVGLWDF